MSGDDKTFAISVVMVAGIIATSTVPWAWLVAVVGAVAIAFAPSEKQP